MMPVTNIKKKLLALIFVFFLFLFVGGLLYSISLNNKTRTEDLKKRVLQIQKEKETIQKLAQMRIGTSTLPEISAKAFLTVAVTDKGQKKILNQKNSQLLLPIASITKLMTAIITLENINPESTARATLDYIGREESAFVLETDHIYRIKDLLANMLISSDNDSARLLSGLMGEENFIIQMNAKAQSLGLTQTKFANVTGLDPLTGAGGVNVSTVTDLAKLLIYLKNIHPEILQLTTQPAYDFCDINGYCKVVINTDKLLDNKDFKYQILGGKTGTTDLAGKNLALLTEIYPGISLVNIVLGSADNFLDTEKLINNIIY